MYYQELANKATNIIKQGQGTLHTIIVNGAGSGWNLQIYDGTTTTGTTISSAAVAIAGATKFACPAAGSNLEYKVTFRQGLIIKTQDGTAGSITVAWD